LVTTTMTTAAMGTKGTDASKAGPKVPAVDVRGVDIARGGELAISGATFAIEQGDYVGIVGPNGGGKTTLVQGLLGLLPLARGEARLFGTPVGQFRDWSRVGYVAQNATAFDPSFPLTVRELVALGRVRREVLGRPLSADDWARVDEALALMDIKGVERRRVGALSGGQKQRVFVAKALVRGPDLLILDEPATGVDAEAQERFFGLLGNVNAQRGTTIVMVSHDLATVFCRMSKVVCVNREVHVSPITPEMDEGALLRRVYGDHFTFVFHRHECAYDEGGGAAHHG
jgi:zinc transport system ATP-binding protein